MHLHHLQQGLGDPAFRQKAPDRRHIGDEAHQEGLHQGVGQGLSSGH